ncbi:unnamed protein product [Durusdinium trenchii]|uniref:Transmembrane protein n=2 Tax=Durusdinium trenchii TaxID=1381693 RepID=A0ABP0P9Y1_9DINO
MKVAGLFGLAVLLPTACSIRDDLHDQRLELKDSLRPNAFVELKSAASGGAAGQAAVRTGKGKRHDRDRDREAPHHRHKKHARRHDDSDDESTDDGRTIQEDYLDASDSDDDGRLDGDEPKERRHHVRRNTRDEVEDGDQAWEEDEEDRPHKGRSKPHHGAREDHEDPDRQPMQDAVSKDTLKSMEKTAQLPTNVTSGAVTSRATESSAPSQHEVGKASGWFLPCFGWSIVVVLVVLVALRIKWPELSDVGVRYVAKRVSLMGKKPREEKSDGREDPQQKKVEVPTDADAFLTREATKA